MRMLLIAAAMSFTAPAFAQDFDAETRALFQFGAGVEAHQDAFDTACSSYERRELDPSENPVAQETLTQVDCDGFGYFGAPRRAEFVFADGALTHVWILTSADEEAALRAAFEGRYGAPSHDADGFIAFTAHNAAIRRDVPEALYYGDAVAPMFAAWFDQASQ